MWLFAEGEPFRARRYIVFGRPVKNYRGPAEVPAGFRVYGKLPKTYGEYRVFTGNTVVTFIRSGDDKAIRSAFIVGGVGGMKRAFLNGDVFDIVSRNFGITGKRLRRIIRASNSVEFVPYFNIESKSLLAVLSKKKHRSVQVLNNRMIVYYSGSRVYRFDKPENFLETLGKVLKGRVRKAPDEPNCVSVSDAYCGLLAGLGDWYMMFDSMFVMNNNVLVANRKNETVMMYPARARLALNAAMFVLEHGSEFFWLL